jgi:uncharacterized membrane protein
MQKQITEDDMIDQRIGNSIKPTPSPIYAWFLTIAGAIGLIASFVITLEKLRLLQNPSYVPSCSINPVISCGSVMKTAQAAVFGFPNSWIGLVGFTAVIVVGVSLLAGATFKAWYWRIFTLGTLFGVAFIHWLFSQSVYVINALCPWCMVVWSVTIPIFWFTLLLTLKGGYWPLPKFLKTSFKFAYDYKFLILACWYLLIVGLILQHFWYYFKTVI